MMSASDIKITSISEGALSSLDGKEAQPYRAIMGSKIAHRPFVRLIIFIIILIWIIRLGMLV
ncbi:hypothetical protein [Moraxella lacunata]|uniref:hypothetical protein n=1 Tax=Moraxella lacunata TaxID=477 RepID=UPI003EE0958A